MVFPEGRPNQLDVYTVDARSLGPDAAEPGMFMLPALNMLGWKRDMGPAGNGHLHRAALLGRRVRGGRLPS